MNSAMTVKSPAGKGIGNVSVSWPPPGGTTHSVSMDNTPQSLVGGSVVPPVGRRTTKSLATHQSLSMADMKLNGIGQGLWTHALNVSCSPKGQVVHGAPEPSLASTDQIRSASVIVTHAGST